MRDFCLKANLKFLGGTNLIKSTLISKKPGWNINPVSAPLYRGAVTVGCGVGGSGPIRDPYTKWIYRSVLSPSIVHSTRDQRTAEVLQALGVRAVNTGCPTTWTLTAEHCAKIPLARAPRVVFTVTDYAQNRDHDLAILDALRDMYEETFVWIQGSRDFQYLSELDVLDRVTLIEPSLSAYRDFLAMEDVDYVGTRLHAGIFAMRHGRRAIIVAVDHRALDMQETHNLNVVPRGDVSELRRMVEQDVVTDVRINRVAIDDWMKQFVSVDA
ncbi:polysaccharide pyruvyl transferase family protein [Tessaracoccus antarcticus]|nr:polysaccharide pyruvyl transferase family protein [Tessaracoccus antarcticus]